MKYKIGDIVKIKATGEKVKIESIGLFINGEDMFQASSDKYFMYPFYESELKVYCPTRTGKYRNEKGQFCSAMNKVDEVSTNFIKKKLIQNAKNQLEQLEHEEPDSKQRNYQKILTTLERIEKKIDELGRKI